MERCHRLSGFAPGSAGLLTRRATLRRFDREQILFSEGDPCTRAHLVVSGIVKLGARTLEGRETIVGLAVPGDLLDDLTILDAGCQPYDAIAATPSEILTIEASALRQAAENDPEVCLWLGRTLASRTRRLVTTATERSTVGATARLAGRLLDLASLVGLGDPAGGIEVRPLLNQGDLARLAGISRESASKTLARLRRAGVIDYDKKALRVMRPDVLERLRCAERASTLSR